jgi:zinc transport system ATP-binding protein
MDDKIILNVNNLCVSLGGEEILKNLSFSVYEDEVLAILGPNGGGKTTLLKALLNIIPYEGEITWKENIKIGYVPQRLNQIKDVPLNIKEFFELEDIEAEETLNILKILGLNKDVLFKKINELSSGQLQRILIGWSIAKDPEVLLFDEPLTGIDIGGQETVYNLLAKLKKEKKFTIIFVTHELSIVNNLADNVLCLNKEMLCNSTPEKVLNPEILSKLYSEEVKFYHHTH